MPRGDRTGPSGNGPMTGRGAGLCAGNAAPGYATGRGGCGEQGRVQGRGSRGRGRGFRHWFYATGLPGWMRMGTPPLNDKKNDPEKGSDQKEESQ